MLPLKSVSLPRLSRIPSMSRTDLYLLLALLGLCSCGNQPETPQDHLTQGDRLLTQGDTSKALAAYRQALARDSLNPDLLARLGRIYGSQGKAEAADTYLRRAADLTYQQALTALKAGDQLGATSALEHTLEITPAHPLALLRLGEICLAKGQEDTALAYFEKATQVNPDYPEGFVKAGRLYLRHQRLQEAQQAFEHAIELNINAKEAYLGLGELYTLQQNWKTAADQYRKVLLIDPHSTAAKDALDRLGPHL